MDFWYGDTSGADRLPIRKSDQGSDVGGIMNEKERQEFLLSTIKPMADFTHPYMVGIIGVEGPTKGVHLGSGFRCMLNDDGGAGRCIPTE